MSNIIHERGIEIMGFQEIDILNTRNDYDMAQDFVNDNYPYVHFAKGRDFADGYFGVGTTSSLEFQEISSVPIESTGSKATKTLERVVVEKRRQADCFLCHAYQLGKQRSAPAVSSQKSSNDWLPIRFRTRS